MTRTRLLRPTAHAWTAILMGYIVRRASKAAKVEVVGSSSAKRVGRVPLQRVSLS